MSPDDLRPPEPDDLAGRTRVFREQAARYGLEYRCDVCVHFLPAPRACSLGYPAHLLDGDPGLCFTDQGQWRFCKYFELA